MSGLGWLAVGLLAGIGLGWLIAARHAASVRKKTLEEASARLSDAFKAASADALHANSQTFLQMAKQALETVLAEARGDLTQRQEAIRGVVVPLQEALKRYEEQIQRLESRRDQDYGDLSRHLKDLNSTQQQLQQETTNLVTALRNPRVRGRWGEVTLRRVVELAGMLRHCDFTEQQVASTEDGERRPDLVVHLPAGRQIVVDAKAPLEAYLDALKASTDEEERVALRRHSQQLRNHLGHLSSKAYWEQFPNSLEFVVMFIPGDEFLRAALEVEPSLVEEGMAHNIVIATPATLMALLRAVERGWRQEKIAESARQISDLGCQLYERLRTLTEHVETIGSSLGRAVEAYNRAVGSLEGRVLIAARKFKDLGAATSEEIPLLEQVDRTPRSVVMERGEEDDLGRGSVRGERDN